MWRICFLFKGLIMLVRDMTADTRGPRSGKLWLQFTRAEPSSGHIPSELWSNTIITYLINKTLIHVTPSAHFGFFVDKRVSVGHLVHRHSKLYNPRPPPRTHTHWLCLYIVHCFRTVFIDFRSVFYFWKSKHVFVNIQAGAHQKRSRTAASLWDFNRHLLSRNMRGTVGLLLHRGYQKIQTTTILA